MRVAISLLLSLIAAGGMAFVFVRFMRRLRQIEEEMWGPPKAKKKP
jgi:hypothetical protein